MQNVEYPTVEKIINLGIPYSVISAGTSLQINNNTFYANYPQGTIELLKAISNHASVFTTRGLLSQAFCNYHNIDKAKFSGDIAFYDKRFNEKTFPLGKTINKIVVSDPHYSNNYIASLSTIINSLKRLFPRAHIVLAQHGTNNVEEICQENKIELMKIYMNRIVPGLSKILIRELFLWRKSYGTNIT